MKKWYNIFVILKIYLFVIVIFFIFRLILFFTQLERIDSFAAEFFHIIEAFLIGIRFDVVIAGYILLLPFFVISLMFIFNKYYGWIYKVIFYWVFILFILAFGFCAADIPFFAQFFARFTVTAFEWVDSPVWMFKMIFQEPRYFIVILPVIVFAIFFFKLLKKILDISPAESHKIPDASKFAVSGLFLVLMIVGTRGTFSLSSSVKVSNARFCDNAFLNQLGINPVFTLVRSSFESLDEKNKIITLMDNGQAIRNVRKYLSIDNPIGDYPVARRVLADSAEENRYNVVLVIMESMSAARMERCGNTKHLTPFLDSLSHKSYYFDNIYTAGIHTYNGIFSTLFSFPAVYRQNSMKKETMFRYNGIANTLKKSGYSTIYFTTHDPNFDNVEGFLMMNDFDNVISQSDYPSEEVKTTLGVPDDFMFEFSLPVIDQLYNVKKPFFVTFMTTSNHTPYYLPDYFKPQNENIKDQMVEYADWSIRKFISMASKKEWFNNTLFVFVADHGAAISADYDLPVDFHHTPLIFYAPGILKESRTFNCIGGQIDVFPTIMGILNQSYINNTLGIDLLSESRPYIFVNHDDRFGVIDKDYLLILYNDGEKSLYKFHEKDKKDYKDEQQQLVRDMEEYTLSNLQTFEIVMHSSLRYVP
jgi:phosphoglycerol transferase MdoB-like AlkP superfamily enzyme